MNTIQKWKRPLFWSSLLLVVTLPTAAYLSGFLGYWIDSFEDPDFLQGLLAEAHGMVLEVLLVVGLLSWITTRRENKRWRPARLILARHICRVHQMLFNSIRWIVDPDFHTDLSRPDVPRGMSQRHVDGLAREQFHFKHLKFHVEKLKKMLEYNVVALDSSLHPKVITFITAADTLLGTCNFVVEAYKGDSEFHGSFDFQSALDMDQVYQDMKEMFPELSELEKPIGPAPVSPEEVLELVKASNEKCSFLKLGVKGQPETA